MKQETINIWCKYNAEIAVYNCLYKTKLKPLPMTQDFKGHRAVIESINLYRQTGYLPISQNNK